jgi:hypothetical protein
MVTINLGPGIAPRPVVSPCACGRPVRFWEALVSLRALQAVRCWECRERESLAAWERRP